MARKNRKQNRISLQKGFLKSIKNMNFDWVGPSLFRLFKITFIAALVSGVGLSLYHIDKTYIRPAQSNATGELLLNMPTWVRDSEELQNKIKEKAGGRIFRLDEKTAAIVKENLQSMAWLDNVSIQTKSDGIYVDADYRIPVAVIQSGDTKFYIDSNLIVLDYVPLPKLLIVEIKLGNSYDSQTPVYGEQWKRPDIRAALQIIEKIHQMDKALKKPLLGEIASIDVSNYHGVKSRSKPEIVLYSLDNTPIHWGVEIGEWSKAMESPDAQKLAKLYAYYEQEGTLSSGQKVNFINLRDPQVKIPLPGDEF